MAPWCRGIRPAVDRLVHHAETLSLKGDGNNAGERLVEIDHDLRVLYGFVLSRRRAEPAATIETFGRHLSVAMSPD